MPIKNKLRPAKLYTLVLLSSVFLSACAPNTTKPTVDTAGTTKAQTKASTSLEDVQWGNFTDLETQKYQAECQQDYKLAVAQFRILEAQQLSPLELLNKINQFDITLERLANMGGLFNNVHPNAILREAAGECEQKAMTLVSEASLSVPIYTKLKAVQLDQLNAINKRYVTEMLEAFELAGVNQPENIRKKITLLNDEILKIGQEFSKNTREDVRTVYATPAQLQGLPEDFIKSHPVDNNGKVALTTNYPDYLPVMQYAVDDDLRLQMYRAFRDRGYPANKTQLHQLLSKRYEFAQLLGIDNFAEYVTSNLMIKTPENAASFIDKINDISIPRSKKDYAELLTRLQKIDPNATEVGDWQKTYIENLIKNEVYKVDAQAIRQYFSYQKVRKGIFDLTEHLFGVEIIPWQTEVWHPSVEAYQIKDQGQVIGQFYLDMHPRDGKYGHAAHFGVRSGVKDTQIPLAALVCNFPGGADDKGPALLEHDQIETFLHEFGHLLHGIFGGHQPWLALSGIKTERDFVEAPSQMLEEWVWDAATLKTFATNTKGEVIPETLVAKMNKGREFGKGIWVRQQLFYAALSLNYYNRPADSVDLDSLMLKYQAEYSPFSYVDGTHMYASFNHLDGYSATYYTYMWSLVIAADMFTEFKKHGLRDPKVAARYRKTILNPGGSKDADELVKSFLGRPVSFDAFAKTLMEE